MPFIVVRPRVQRLAPLATVLLILATATGAHAETYVVNSDRDVGAQSPIGTSCRTGFAIVLPSGIIALECTFRAALETANANPGLDSIEFSDAPAIPTGFLELSPASAYPILTDPVVIDGYSHPAYDTAADLPAPIVQLSGGSVPGLSAGLTFVSGSDGSIVRGLAIRGFPGSGLLISSALAAGPQNILVQGNHLGVSRGVFYFGNGDHGIHLNFSDGHTIGQVCNATSGCSGRGNLISGNAGSGIHIQGSDDNRIAGNRIGTDRTGTLAFVPFGGSTANDEQGVHILGGSTGNSIGDLGSIASMGIGTPTAVVSGNLISGNGGDGIALEDATGNSIVANHIGTNAAGTGPLGNGRNGIRDDAESLIGGEGLAGNLISGNALNGILATFGPSSILGNRIGTDVSGTSAIPNGASGLVENGSDILIRENVIDGNSAHGIYLRRSGIVRSNWIGTNAQGDDLGNGDSGLFVSADFVTVGEPGAGNVIGFNSIAGIEFDSGAQQVRLPGNWIGTDASGADLGNDGYGVILRGSENTIGELSGWLTGGANTIGHNLDSGVLIDTGATGARVLANFIGTDAFDRALGNQIHGVLIQTDDSQVGGSLSDDDSDSWRSGNSIAHNALAGIRAPAHHGNLFRGNRFWANGIQAIDLDTAGSDPNDFGDTDAGANNRQNSPAFQLSQTQFVEATGDVEIRYRVDSNLGDAAYPIKVDFYVHDPWLFPGDQARRYIGSDEFPAASIGVDRNVSITPVAGPLEANGYGFVFEGLRATATDAAGNTSELSVQRVPVPEPNAITGIALGIGAILLVAPGSRYRRHIKSDRGEPGGREGICFDTAP